MLTIPFCEQEDFDNPELLCGYYGMVEPEVIAGSAAIGAALGYLIGGSPDVSRTFMLVPTSLRGNHLGLTLAVRLGADGLIG